MSYRKGSYREYLRRLHMIWYPRGIFDYMARRFKLVDWHKDQLRIYIRDTRLLLDELEAKLDGR